MPINYTNLLKDTGISPAQLLRIKKEKLVDGVDFYRGKEKSPLLWFTDEGAEKVKLALAVPLAVPDRVEVRVVKAAPNPRFVYAKLSTQDAVVPVLIPRQLYGRLVGKVVRVDIIKDASGGVTYRHEALAS